MEIEIKNYTFKEVEIILAKISNLNIEVKTTKEKIIFLDKIENNILMFIQDFSKI